jgi:hypothetical protein
MIQFKLKWQYMELYEHYYINSIYCINNYILFLNKKSCSERLTMVGNTK